LRRKGSCWRHRQVFQVTNRSPGQEGGSRRPLGLAASLTQRRQELLPVLVVPENLLPLIPAIHHVANRSRILHYELSGHPANRVCTSQQGGGPLSQLGADAPMASETLRAVSTASTSVSVSGLTEGEACFCAVLIPPLLL